MSKILIVDDDVIVQMVLKKALVEQGYEVVVAKNGEEGIEQAIAHHPALIICDWMMPGTDGLEVCRQIKQNESLSTTFFILLTARSDVKDRVRGLDNGADDFLSKPIEFTELTARVRAGLRLYQLNQDLREQKQLVEKQKRLLESELNEAAEYVRSLLPKPLSSTVKIDSAFIPSSRLGGDCFDYYWLDENRMVIYLLDTSGHGVGAALLSISVLNLLRSKSQTLDFGNPSAVMKELNQAFQMTQQGNRYFSMWYGVYHQADRRLVYANAGHSPAILISKDMNGSDRVQKLDSLSMPVGFFLRTEFLSAECHIPPGSKLYIFSDGIYEIKQSDGKLWGINRLIELMSEDASDPNVSGVERVVNYVQQANGSSRFRDDVSLLKVQFDP
ncbi:SpoIIE family protein phosphatase [Pseudanabaena sp. PCC 6802]|uniref:SpoIIE family protein phosphatase n=1 Tax=Pseudanabaena sp. PCC 6802 TaxID=118173 RepID=UPI00034C2C83|nr:SpoIIE family protein phosphatase [Pseudanabaena sp. PCC 6802]